MLERADFEWLRYQNVKLKGFDSRIPEKPSEYFRRNIKLTYLRDTVAIRTCDLLGEDTLMFQTDFPHGISTYPNSRKMCDDMFAGVDPALRDKIVYQTAADLYRSEEHTSELQSLMRTSYAVFCLTKKKTQQN